MLHFNYTGLRNFFIRLNKKEKISFLGRLLFTSICISLILYLYIKTKIFPENVYISAVCLITACLFFGKTAYLAIHIPLFYLSVIDIHLFKTYNLSVFSAGDWLYALIPDTNKTEIIEYLSKISFFEKISLLAGLILSVACLFYRPAIRAGKKVYFAVFLLLPFSYAEHIAPVVYYHFFDNEEKILAKARNFRFNPQPSDKRAHNVIVLIGESHRYPEFHQALRKYAARFDALYEFKDMISTSPGTMNSVPMILSRKKFTDRTKYFYEKSLFSLFKEAGYTTYFLHYTNNSQERNHLSFIYNEADHFINFHPAAEGLHDRRIYPELNRILKHDKTKKLVVIKMIGVHENFEHRYPPEYDTRKPSLQYSVQTEDETFLGKIKLKTITFFTAFKTNRLRKKENKDIVLNTYKNAVDYSADIVAGIIGLTKNQKEPSLLVFSSDHGICIYDKGYLHLPPNCKNAFHIPAMIYLNDTLKKITSAEKLNNLACNTEKPLTQEYFFDTISSLSGINYPAFDKSHDLTAGCIYPQNKKRPVDTLSHNRPYYYEDL